MGDAAARGTEPPRKGAAARARPPEGVRSRWGSMPTGRAGKRRGRGRANEGFSTISTREPLHAWAGRRAPERAVVRELILAQPRDRLGFVHGDRGDRSEPLEPLSTRLSRPSSPRRLRALFETCRSEQRATGGRPRLSRETRDGRFTPFASTDDGSLIANAFARDARCLRARRARPTDDSRGRASVPRATRLCANLRIEIRIANAAASR